MKKSKLLGWTKMILLGTIIFIFLIPYPSYGIGNIEVNVEVETKVGPEFDPFDKYQLTNCFYTSMTPHFPYDFIDVADIGDEPNLEDSCPSLTIFGNTHEACFLIDIYEKIEPAIILGMYIYAITNL